jgi:urease alpha subunit
MLKKIAAPAMVTAVLVGGVGLGWASTAGASIVASTTRTTQVKGHSHARAWVKAHRRQIRRAVVGITAKTIDVAPQALVGELRSGKSIAQVASEHGVATQTVESALVKAADARINLAVTNHKLTSTQGSKIESKVPAAVTKLVNHEFGQKGASKAA